MDNMEKLRTFLKPVLPIVDDVDLDVVIVSSVVFAYYYGELAEKDDVTDDEFKFACSLIVTAFNGDTIHYLEECIQEFKEEVF